MTAYVTTKHQGKLKNEYSFGSVSSNDVIIRAIKKAENSDEILNLEQLQELLTNTMQ